MFERRQCIIRLSIAEFLCPEVPVDFLLFLECNRRLCNRIARNIGLIVCVDRVVAYRQKTISIVTAFSDYEVICSVLLFRPEEGDIGIARLKEQEKKLGLVLSMSFFGDIHVSPAYFLNDTYFFQPNRQCWYVKAAGSGNDGQPIYNKITSNCYVRFKVRDTLFPKLQYNTTATAAGSSASAAGNDTSNASSSDSNRKLMGDTTHRPEMLVKAAVNYKMFGPIEMWMSPQQYNDLYKPVVAAAVAVSVPRGGGAVESGGGKFNNNKRKYGHRGRGGGNKQQQGSERPQKKTTRKQKPAKKAVKNSEKEKQKPLQQTAKE